YARRTQDAEGEDCAACSAGATRQASLRRVGRNANYPRTPHAIVRAACKLCPRRRTLPVTCSNRTFVRVVLTRSSAGTQPGCLQRGPCRFGMDHVAMCTGGSRSASDDTVTVQIVPPAGGKLVAMI